MSHKRFFDTNVISYAYDTSVPARAKRERADDAKITDETILQQIEKG